MRTVIVLVLVRMRGVYVTFVVAEIVESVAVAADLVV
jgi:hypothetical protein